MLETFTPAVCGSRKRQVIAQAFFTVAAVATAAALGLALGFAGSLLGASHAVWAAAALALAGAAREAGLIRLPLPQARRQVPERWRFELPLPVWATGYGAGLGAGFFTFQPVSTFWVALAGCLAVAQPVPAAICLSLYGAGRAAMVIWPRRRADDPTAAVERLTSRRGALLRANAIGLGVCALLLFAAAPGAGAATLVAQNAYDPTLSAGTLAFATRDGQVVVRPFGGGPEITFPNASQPSLDGELLAYRSGNGIRVVRWANGDEVGRIDSATISHPALDWPLVAFVRRDGSYERLVVRNLQSGAHTIHATAKPANNFGRPALRDGRLAWHNFSRTESRIVLKSLSNGSSRVVARSRIALLTNPTLAGARLAWVESRSGRSTLKVGWVAKGRTVRALESMKTRVRGYWTISLGSSTLYSTRWTLSSGASSVYRTGL